MSDLETGKNTEPVSQPAASGRIIVMANKSHQRRKLWLIIGGAILLVAAAAVAWYLILGPGKASSNVAFTIDGQDYTRDQINSLIAYPVSRGASREDAAKQAFEMYKHQKAAEKTGVVISDDQLVAAQKKLFINSSNTDETVDANAEAWMKLASYDNVLTEMLATSPIYSNASGYIYLFWFTHHLTYNADHPVDGVGDEKLIAADRQYSQDRANYYRQQLIDQKMTPDQVLQAIKADDRLGYTAGFADNQSLRFTEISYSDQYDSILRNIPMTAQERAVQIGSKTGVDDIQIGSITITDADAAADSSDDGEGANPRQADAYFYLVDIDKASTKNYNMSAYTTALDSLSSSYRGIE